MCTNLKYFLLSAEVQNMLSENGTAFPKFDLTVTVSVIIALCAIISPILTSLINNRHQLKLKKLELEQQHLEKTVSYYRSIFEQYLKSCSKHLEDLSVFNHTEYTECYLTALLYAPQSIVEEMKLLNTQIMSRNYREAPKTAETLTRHISEWLQTL